jgi:hypothetical protein
MGRCVGTDIGTGYISSAEKGEEEGKVVFRKVRDCFFKVDPKQFLGGANPMFGEKMLKKNLLMILYFFVFLLNQLMLIMMLSSIEKLLLVSFLS